MQMNRSIYQCNKSYPFQGKTVLTVVWLQFIKAAFNLHPGFLFFISPRIPQFETGKVVIID